MRLNALGDWAQANRWIWSAVGVLLIWAMLSLLTNRFSLQSLTGVLTSASFLTIVGLGQMLVVTTGRGNIDLSVPSVMTLSAYLAIVTIRGDDAMLLAGLLSTLLLGIAIGALNSALVIWLRVPAIIATLGTGYVFATATLLANGQIRGGFLVSPFLRQVASGRLAGVPIVVVLAVLAVAVAAFVLRRTAYGRMLSAVGQNRRAAMLSGIRVDRVVASAFITSSVLAAFTGLLLGAYINGAFLEMGQPYLLQSIAAVVIGGTLIFGGSATALGTFFAAILLILIVTTMQIAGLPPGTQDIVQGVVVIAVLALAGRRVLRRTAHPDGASRSQTPEPAPGLSGG